MPKPIPPDWALTYEQLIDLRQKERNSPWDPRDEVRWANEYERSLLPKNARYPAAGDIYVCEQDADVEVLYFRRGNYPENGSGAGRILTGERIWVFAVDAKIEPRPLSVGVNIESADAFARRCIPETVRAQPHFDGFVIMIRTRHLLDAFRLECAAGAV